MIKDGYAIYIKHSKERKLFLLVYVNDIFIAGDDDKVENVSYMSYTCYMSKVKKSVDNIEELKKMLKQLTRMHKLNCSEGMNRHHPLASKGVLKGWERSYKCWV